MKLTKLGAIVAGAVLVVGACSTGGGGGATKGTLKIGVELPLSGGEAPNGQPTLKGVKLAVDEANEKGGVGGYKLELTVLDDAVNGKNNPQQGAKNMQTLAADSKVVAVVGPYNSAVAKAQIPISNEAGLLQCSPANTNETLTKTTEFRPKFPNRINYIRVATTDDIQGPAMATYAFKNLGIKNILIIDDVTTFGKGIADNFQRQYESLGGKVAQRVGADKNTTDFVPILTAAKALNPDGVYYGGVTTSGAGLLRKQMPGVGLGNIPITGGDGIQDGSAEAKGSFLNISGDAAGVAFSTVAAIGDFPGRVEFEKRYADHYKNDADFKTAGAYSGPAYACTQVILKALEETLKGNPANDAAIREGVRTYATTSTNKFDSVIGQISFDQNGDTSQHIISFYENQGGKWIFKEQIDFSK